jgi:hypothetical protein
MTRFEDRAARIVTTAAQIAKLQGAALEASLLEQARAEFVETGYDNWDGGITFYTLMLEVPIRLYASVGERREPLEKAIQSRVAQIVRGETGSHITDVVISPVLAEESRPAEPEPATDVPPEDIPSFWQAGFFRLFITHVALHRAKAHELKEHLARFQVAAFVAHDDIEPTREWQAEIERALRTMDALVALISPEFLGSRWCDQEVGIAVGRGKLVVPLRCGADPHGFLGKYQGLQADDLDSSVRAERIADILIQNPQSSARMADALVERVASALTYESAKRATTLVERLPALNTRQVARLLTAIEDNDQVRDAFGVPVRLRALAERYGGGRALA